MTVEKIYLDYNATTPCDAEVVAAMTPYLTKNFGNPSSIHHSLGWIAKEALDDATEKIGGLLNIKTDNIIYTSGSTEGINMVLKSFSQKFCPSKNHIITCKTEHKAVLDTLAFMEEYEGVSVTYLDVDHSGLVDLQQLKDAIIPETSLVVIMHANNETGVIQPLRKIAKIIEKHNIFLFSDTTQSLGKHDLNDVLESVDFACFSAHKVYGPKGVGMVYFKNRRAHSVLKNLIQGGGQQKGWRGGTLNTPGIVGFVKAIELACDKNDQEISRLRTLRDMMEEGLLKIDMSYVNGGSTERLPNTSNMSFSYVNGADLLRALSKDMAVSNGSACNSVSDNPSHVLTAMGVKPELAFSSIRFSLGKFTTAMDVQHTIEIVRNQIELLRENNILWELRNKK